MEIIYREGTDADSRVAFEVFHESVNDLSTRLGFQALSGGNDPAAHENLWERRRPMYQHLAATGSAFWLAEQDDKVIGYARAVVRGGLQELTELFIRPGVQSTGVGRELLTRVFSEGDASHRCIIASPDIRALALYMRAGVYVRFPIFYLGRDPEVVPVPPDLEAVPITSDPETLIALNQIDREVLGHSREIDHQWLMTERSGFLYRRHGKLLGYGYLGYQHGPFALFDSSDFPAILAHAETIAATKGLGFSLDVPGINQVAIDYLLNRRCQINTFWTHFLSNHPFGQFDRYIAMTPTFLL